MNPDDFECGSSESVGGLAGDTGRGTSAPRRVGKSPQNPKLARTIESEIIPRLMLMHRAGTITLDSTLDCAPGAHPTDSEVRELAVRSYTQTPEEVWQYVRGVQARGVQVEAIDLELLAPAARLLGEMWTEDEADFTQVTVGLSRMRQVLHRLSPEFTSRCPETAETPDRRKRVLVAPTPGEQHTFGLMIVSEFLRRDGWVVREPLNATLGDLVTLVRSENFSVVALSAACESHLEELAQVIGALRRASTSQPLGVLVGGPAFAGFPDRVARVGADGTAADGREVPAQAHRLMELVAARA
jgi:MerR family transcriptional regulator, light-induced transcriptional regulator